MTTLISLSHEVIDVILSYNDISFEDIINFRCVCKKFRWAAKTGENCFLKKKFYQRWPSAKKYYDKHLKKNEQKQSEENKPKNEKPISFIETGINNAKQLRNYVHKKMSVLKCNRTENVHLNKNLERELTKNLEREFTKKDLNELLFEDKNYINILFFIDEIKRSLDQPIRVGYDLTEKYYYTILFDSLSMLWRKVILERYSKKQPYKKLLEESATIWAQQLQLEKNISYSSVKASLKNIALEALNFLREKYPEHSIFSTPDEYFSYWEDNKIDDNYWSEAEGTQIMDTLEKYMFDKLKFRATNSKELKYTCIDYVLENKHGNDVIIYIIYESVARRLGLRCDLVQTLYGFSSIDILCINILWIPRYSYAVDYKKDKYLLNIEGRKNMKCFKIDESLNLRPKVIFKDYELLPVYRKTAAEMLKLIRNMGTSFSHIILPSTNLIQDLESFMRFQTRSKDVKFAVGMIVTHGDESTDCSTGVIIGWLPIGSRFISNIDSKSYFIMPFKMCSYFYAKETCYIVLTKSDKLCYVKEDDITLTKPNWIENKNIYYYFSKFEGTHYVANTNLKKLYPHDAAIAAGTI